MKREVTECDVYGTIKNVLPVRVTIQVGDDQDSELLGTKDGVTDLSERAIKRLRKFIDRGLSKPTERS